MLLRAEKRELILETTVKIGYNNKTGLLEAFFATDPVIFTDELTYMTNSKRNAIISGLVALFVLCSLYLQSAASLAVFGGGREKSAAAVRYLPVYSYLTPAETNDSFAIDAAHGGEGYIALTAKSEEEVRVKIIHDSGAERVYLVPRTGEVAYYPLSDGSGHYAIQIMKKVKDSTNAELYERAMEGACDAALFDEFQPFLRPSTYVWFTGYSNCVNAAAKLCTGESNDDRKIELVKSYVAGELDYDDTLAENGDQTYIRDPDEILARKTATCLDYAVVTAAMLRSQGIPAKVVYGNVEQGTTVFHAWNMVYTSSRGWFRVDVTYADHGIVDSFIADDSNYTDAGWY